MKTIALRGQSNTGKTETLMELSKVLERRYDFRLHVIRRDAYCIGKINGKRIAVITAGDDMRALNRYIGYLMAEHFWEPDILFIACHNGKTSEYLESISSNIVFVEHEFLNDAIYDQTSAYKLHKKEAKILSGML